jgi:hypothetical protein
MISYRVQAGIATVLRIPPSHRLLWAAGGDLGGEPVLVPAVGTRSAGILAQISGVPTR